MKKSRFDQDAEDFLSGEKLMNYLDFADFLKKNKVTKSATSKPSSQNSSWAVRYKKRMICHFRAWRDGWFISFFKSVDINQYEPFITSEMKAFILDNIATKPGCKGCKGNKDRMIFGQKFDVVCGCHLLIFVNPNGDNLARAKELVLATKKVVDAHEVGHFEKILEQRELSL